MKLKVVCENQKTYLIECEQYAYMNTSTSITTFLSHDASKLPEDIHCCLWCCVDNGNLEDVTLDFPAKIVTMAVFDSTYDANRVKQQQHEGL